MFPLVRNAIHVVAGVIQGIGMHINLVTYRISEHKVTFPCVIAGSFTVTASGEEFAQLRYLTVGYGDVEVVMGVWSLRLLKWT